MGPGAQIQVTQNSMFQHGSHFMKKFLHNFITFTYCAYMQGAPVLCFGTHMEVRGQLAVASLCPPGGSQ